MSKLNESNCITSLKEQALTTASKIDGTTSAGQ